jgi:lipopolysaccharide transport system ATP-binding protein
MNDIVIKAEHVSKKFCKSLRYVMTYGALDITKDFFSIISKTEELRNGEFLAVNDVSFELKRGETLGIIGHNGAGKSTILKMLNGIYMPDKGRIQINGRVGALIEVGAGFHPMLTGRENIYVSGAILGISKKEIKKRFDDIVDFADIGDFLDTPVKYYSSGMYVRLGFAVAVFCEPDILLVDEVLAVGDKDFQIKCFQKISELVKNGVSIILISHNEYTIVEYTSKALFLKEGKQMFLGESEEAVTHYINNLLQEKKDRNEKELKGHAVNLRKKKIVGVTFRNSKMETIKKITCGDALIVDFKYEVNEEIKNPIFGISFYSNKQLMVGLFNSCASISLPPINGPGVVRLSVDSFLVPSGVYQVSYALSEGSIANTLDWEDFGNIIVEKEYGSRGLIKLKQEWKVLG